MINEEEGMEEKLSRLLSESRCWFLSVYYEAESLKQREGHMTS